MFPSDDRYDRMLRILAQRGYITEGDVPTKDYEAVLKEMCELDWLTERNGHYVPGERAIEFGWEDRDE